MIKDLDVEAQTHCRRVKLHDTLNSSNCRGGGNRLFRRVGKWVGTRIEKLADALYDRLETGEDPEKGLLIKVKKEDREREFEDV